MVECQLMNKNCSQMNFSQIDYGWHTCIENETQGRIIRRRDVELVTHELIGKRRDVPHSSAINVYRLIYVVFQIRTYWLHSDLSLCRMWSSDIGRRQNTFIHSHENEKRIKTKQTKITKWKQTFKWCSRRRQQANKTRQTP